MIPPETIKVLEDCEIDLRRIAGMAMQAGEYASVRRITDWAETLKGMVAGAKGNSVLQTATPVREGTQASNEQPRKRPARDEYPRFLRRGDELVKVGWSKKERTEYIHRAPRRAVHTLVRVVKEIGARGKVFTSDEILPLKDADGSEFPPYQAYLALAWFKQLGLVLQHGRRGGYTLVVNGELDSAIGGGWSALPEWRG